MAKQCECPKCNSDEHVVSWYAVLFTLRDWPTIFLLVLFITFTGGILELSAKDTALFLLLCLFPLLFRFLNKFGCVKCQIEFYAEESGQGRSLAPTGAGEE